MFRIPLVPEAEDRLHLSHRPVEPRLRHHRSQNQQKDLESQADQNDVQGEGTWCGSLYDFGRGFHQDRETIVDGRPELAC